MGRYSLTRMISYWLLPRKFKPALKPGLIIPGGVIKTPEEEERDARIVAYLLNFS